MRSYLDKYDVLKNFKTNEYQKILIASDKEDPDKVVVINIINRNNTSEFISKSQFPKGLNNLVHLEEINNDIIVVTDYLEGTSFSTYINYLETNLKHKTSLTFEYLNKILCYDAFNNSIKKQLVSESQITFKDNYIFFNELLLIDALPEQIQHKEVNIEISNVIEKIIFSGRITDASPSLNPFIQRLKDFIERLRTSDSFKSINDICEAFRKIYLYDMYSSSNDVEEESTGKTIIPIIADLDSDLSSDINKDLDSDLNTSEEPSIEEPITEQSLGDTLTREETVYVTDNHEQDELKSFESELYHTASHDFSSLFDGNNGPKEITLDGLSVRQPIKKRHNKPKKEFIIAGIVIALLLAVGAYALTKLPLSEVMKPDEAKVRQLDAHFTYSKVDDDGLYKFENDSILPTNESQLTSVVWNVYQENTLLSSLKKNNPSIQFTNIGSYRVELIVTDTEKNTDTYSAIIEFDKKYDIDDLADNDTSESLNNLSLSYSDTINKDNEAYRTGSYSLKLGAAGETKTESIIINNISLEDNPVISFWVASSTTDNVNIFIEGLKNNKVLVSKRINHLPSSELAWDRVKYTCPNSNINRVRLTFKNLSSSIWIDDIKIDYYK